MSKIPTDDLSPEDIKQLLSDENTYKAWIIQQIVSINKRLDNLDRTNKMYQWLLGIVLSVMLGLISILVTTR